MTRLSELDHIVREAVCLSDMIATVLSRADIYQKETLELVVEYIQSSRFSNDPEDKPVIEAIVNYYRRKAFDQ